MTSGQSTTSIVMDEICMDEISMDETLGEDIFETMRRVDNNFLKLTKSLQIIKREKLALEKKEDKTPEELTKLSQVQEKLACKIKEFNEQLILAKKILVKMQDKTYNLINPYYDDSTELKQTFQGSKLHLPKSPKYDSTGEFHKVIALNHNNETEKLPQIMILQSMNNFIECNDSCQFYSSCSESNCSDDLCCCDSPDDCEKDTVPVISCESDSLESENLVLKNELCKLKMCFENVFNENKELQSKLRDIVERNNSLACALERPAQFKISSTGEIRFPGKKKMEEKLLALKNEIIQLKKEIDVQQISQLKLKMVRECIAEYNSTVTHCKCENPKYQDNIETIINVKKQKIKHIEVQFRDKNHEKIKTINDYESSVKRNKIINSKINKLSKCITALNQKIKDYNSEAAVGKQLKDELSKKAEEIATKELMVEKCTDEIQDYNEKLKKVEEETSKILEKTTKLECSLKSLTADFMTKYKNLKSDFQEKMNEMMALPTLLKITHIKIQEENDIRMLAEETREKLELQIKQAESLKTPDEPEDEATRLQRENALISMQLAENEALESKLKCLEKNIESAKAELDEETRALDAVNQVVENAKQSSTRQINAFRNFLTIYKGRLVSDLNKIRELLTELQDKECAKAHNKKEFMDQLKININSIHRKLEECKLEMQSFVNNEWNCDGGTLGYVKIDENALFKFH